MTTAGLDPWPWPGEPWDWLGEPLAADFANTLKRRGRTMLDLLRGGDDLAEWAGLEDGRVPAVSAEEAAARLDEVRAVRDDVAAVLRAAVDGADAAAAVARLDGLARRRPVVAQLGAEDGVVAGDPSPLDELLARVVAGAIVLGRDATGAGLGFCDAPSCGQFFVRDRPDQRWCDPSCGTRARVARHAERHRGS
jgi:predicted RNA-binding Zn ribbon-like protein